MKRIAKIANTSWGTTKIMDTSYDHSRGWRGSGLPPMNDSSRGSRGWREHWCHLFMILGDDGKSEFRCGRPRGKIAAAILPRRTTGVVWSTTKVVHMSNQWGHCFLKEWGVLTDRVNEKRMNSVFLSSIELNTNDFAFIGVHFNFMVHPIRQIIDIQNK